MTSQIPAYLLSHTRKRNVAAAAAQGLASSRPAHISILGNKFTLIDSAGNQRPVGYLHEGNLALDVVIVYANPVKSKVFYDDVYDSDNTAAPICFSDNGVAPSINAVTPQAQLCSTCPKNAWGSALSQKGKQIKACKDAKKIAVLVPSVAGDMLFQLKIPPNSLSGFNAYVRQVDAWDLGPRKADVSDITTRLQFVSQGTFSFEPTGLIEENVAEMVFALDTPEAEAKLDALVGKDDKPLQGALPAPQEAVQPRIAVAPMPSPVSAPIKLAPVPIEDTHVSAPEHAAPTRRGPRARRAAEPTTDSVNVVHSVADDLGDDDGMPAFLKSRAAEVVHESPSKFGIVQQPAPPSAALKSAIESAFSLPIRK